MTNNFFVFYRAYNPNILIYPMQITLENSDPFLFEDSSSYIYTEYATLLNFTSQYNNRIYPEFNNFTVNLKTNYFISVPTSSLSTTIDLQNSRSLFYENNDLIYLEYNSQITSSESGSNNISVNLNYYVSESISTGSVILLETSRSLYLSDFGEFLLES